MQEDNADIYEGKIVAIFEECENSTRYYYYNKQSNVEKYYWKICGCPKAAERELVKYIIGEGLKTSCYSRMY